LLSGLGKSSTRRVSAFLRTPAVISTLIAHTRRVLRRAETRLIHKKEPTKAEILDGIKDAV